MSFLRISIVVAVDVQFSSMEKAEREWALVFFEDSTCLQTIYHHFPDNDKYSTGSILSSSDPKSSCEL